MRRRTKPRVVWLPATNNNSVSPDSRSGIGTFILSTGVDASNRNQAEVPILIDGNPSVLTAATLDDVENNGYRLRRIVGKIFCFQQQVAGNNPAAVIVTAGLIVRRVSPTTGFSLAFLDGTGKQIDTQDLDNWGDPWIWRRSWVLANALSTDGGDSTIADVGPFSNMEYGSVADGPHVDAKTARIVGPEERLFLDVTVGVLEGLTAGGVNDVKVVFDLRCLASMRTGAGNRRNASR